LQAERYSDYRSTQEQTVDSGGYCQRDSADEQPNYIHDQRHRSAAVFHFLTKRRERQRCEFEALPPYWDSDDGYTPQQSHEKPPQRLPYAAAQHPYQIT
jgi:hypothetical protein